MLNKNRSHPTILIILMLLSVIVAISINYDITKPQTYTYLPFLPLTFGFTTILFYKIYYKASENIALLLITGGYFIKLVIGPLSLMLGNYSVMFTVDSSEIINKAILLMIYETLFVYLFINMYIKSSVQNAKKLTDQILDIEKFKVTNTFKIVFWIIIMYIFFIFFYIPEIQNLYTSIFDTEESATEIFYDSETIVERGGIKRPLLTLGIMAVGFMRYFIPAFFLILIRKKVGQKNIGLVLSVPFVLSPFLLIGATNAEPLYGVIVSALLLTILYPEKIHYIKSFFILSTLIFITYFMSLKITAFANWTGTQGYESLSQTIQAYFSGIVNVAASFNVNNPTILKTLFYDIYSAIPFRGSFFNLEELKLVTLYNEQNSVSGQIIPLISQSAHYLGFVLAPVIPCLFAYLAIKFAQRLNNENNFWKIVTFSLLIVLLALTPTLYNFTIFLTLVLNVILPMYLIAFFTKKRIKMVN